MKCLNVVLTGRLFTETDCAAAIDGLAAITYLQPAKVERLPSSGPPAVVKGEVELWVVQPQPTAEAALSVAEPANGGDTNTP